MMLIIDKVIIGFSALQVIDIFKNKKVLQDALTRNSLEFDFQFKVCKSTKYI